MYKRILRFLCFSLFIFIPVLLLQYCNDNLSPSGNYIAGTITFVDTNIITSGGYYALSVYASQSSPFSYLPLRNDSLVIQRSGDSCIAHYKVNLDEGDYYVGATWIRLPFNQNIHPPVLGTYGCDTSLSCTHHTKISIPNYAGAGDCCFKSWTDTTKKFP
jgi:hypothetical protein